MFLSTSFVSVTASERAPLENAAAQREAKMRQALNQADLSNAISFALTFDSKWGDYDPEGIASHWDEKPGANTNETGNNEDTKR